MEGMKVFVRRGGGGGVLVWRGQEAFLVFVKTGRLPGRVSRFWNFYGMKSKKRLKFLNKYNKKIKYKNNRKSEQRKA